MAATTDHIGLRSDLRDHYPSRLKEFDGKLRRMTVRNVQSARSMPS
jgi:hypothetical protein